MYEILRRHPGKRSILSGCRSGDYENISRSGSEAATGNATAGDLVGGEGAVVLVGEMDESVDFRGLLKPVDKGGHFSAGRFLDASNADADDYEGHGGNSEMYFGAFPQTELDGTVFS